MPRKNKMKFKLDPEWMLKEPVDFEFNKYTLLDYVQKCEKKFDNLEIYPDFVEVSLHLANLQSLVKENTILLTKKKFESCDDEILLKELYPKKPRNLTLNETQELERTIKFSGAKLFDTFNLGKSIWNLAFDNIHLSIKKNKENLVTGRGYCYFLKKPENIIYVWQYEIRREKNDEVNNKTYLDKIFEGTKSGLSINNIIHTFSTWNQMEGYDELPIFEIKTTQDFPMEATFVPIMKRKIMTYVFQIVNMQILKNFDSQKET